MIPAEQYLLCYAYLIKAVYCSKPRMLLVEIPSLQSLGLYLYSHLMPSGSSPINTLLANPFLLLQYFHRSSAKAINRFKIFLTL